MNTIQELIGKEATDRLKERYGVLVDKLSVREEFIGVFKITLQMFTLERLRSNPTDIERGRAIGTAIANIERALYGILDFGEGMTEKVIHLNFNLPRNGIHMHPAIYYELMKSEKESMMSIEERLGDKMDKKGAMHR